MICQAGLPVTYAIQDSHLTHPEISHIKDTGRGEPERESLSTGLLELFTAKSNGKYVNRVSNI